MPHTASLSSLFLLLGTLACASGPAPLPGDEGPALPAEVRETSTGVNIRLAAEQLAVNSEVGASVERVWSALPGAYSALGIDGQVLDATERVYGSRRFTKGRVAGTRVTDFVRCAFQGTGASAVGGYRTQLSIISKVEPSSSSHSILTTKISGHATSVEGTSTGAVRCVSNGNLERIIAATVSDSVSN